MRYFVTFSLLIFSSSALLSQAECDYYNRNYEVINKIKHYYFKESNGFVIVHPCRTDSTLRSKWYSCLTLKDKQNIEGDSLNLLLVCCGHSGDRSEFMFVKLLNYIEVPEINTPIGFQFNKDFLRIVEFKVDSFGLVIEESETHLEPH